MKYSELTESAKLIAAQDYINGWKETHEDEEMSINEAKTLCLDSEDDVEYNEDGSLRR